MPGQAYIHTESGKITFLEDDRDDWDDLNSDEDEPELFSDDGEMLPIDPISSHASFRWMEDFIESVHSIPLQTALRRALRNKKPFRGFKDALTEYPRERERWFKFEAQKLTEEDIELLERLDWDILEVVDPRPTALSPAEIDPEDRLPLTSEEHEWILRGAWEIAARGGRTQLGLLLKGSKNKELLKHNLQASPAYGRLSFLTLEEIERRIDQVIRQKDLQIEDIGDLPRILLTDEAWNRIRPWANQYECEQAASADEKALVKILLEWRGRRREDQAALIDAAAALEPEA